MNTHPCSPVNYKIPISELINSEKAQATHPNSVKVEDKEEFKIMIFFIYVDMCNCTKIWARIRRGADKSLAFLISPTSGYSTTKRIFLGWVKEVGTRSHKCVELRGEYVE
jgi:hypothetical protein